MEEVAMEGATDRSCATESCEGKRHGLDTTGFCRECKRATNNKPKARKPKAVRAVEEAVEELEGEIGFTESQLDRLYARFSVQAKTVAVQAGLLMEDDE